MPVKLTTSLVVLTAMSLSNVNAYWGIGWCPIFAPDPVKPNGDFEVEKYMGNWYEIKRDKDLWYEKDTTCVTASYTYTPAWW